MQFVYFSQELFDEAGAVYTAYGIKSINDKESIFVKDITLKKDCIEKLCDMLNSNQIERCHIPEIIQDFICSINTVKIKRSLIYG